MNPIAALQSLGLTEYEARAYLVLAERGALNGYEVAKHSGIPRANVYAALERLERRALAVAVQHESAVRYAACAPEDVVRRLRRDHEVAFERAAAVLAELKTAEQPAHVLNIGGYEAALQHARGAIAAARSSLLVALRPPEARALAEDLALAQKRGVDITTLCMSACESECGGCRGRLYRYRVTNDADAHWLIVVLDDSRVVAATITGSDANAIETVQPLVAELAAAYIRNAIGLATVLRDTGDSLESTLSNSSKAILETLGPGNGRIGFLQHIQSLLRNETATTTTTRSEGKLS